MPMPSTRVLLSTILALTLVSDVHTEGPRAQAPAAEGHTAGFTPHTIGTDLAGGYQVVIADLNRDRRPDIIALASGLTELRWYENPGWQKHVLATGINRPINAAVHDIDGDGIPEVAVAHEFSNVYANSLGVVSVLTHQGDPARPWSVKEIDRLPTAHRLRFADITGSGRKVLINYPLIGPRALAPDYRDRLSLVMYRPGDWKREVITDAEEGDVHGIQVVDWPAGRREALLSASFLGIHMLEFERGAWTRTRLTTGDPRAWPKGGASDVAAGQLGRERFLAAIEPWHGNTVAVYRREQDEWRRAVVDQTIGDGHTLVVADLDGDGRDEIVIGERQGKRSAYVYRHVGGGPPGLGPDARRTDAGEWSKRLLDDGGMAAAGCAVEDLNADRRPDVVCIGTATMNLKWYENQSTGKSEPR
jgi:hypothetical protein